MTTTDKNFDLNRADSLLNMKLDLGYMYPVAIDLEEAINNPNSSANILLRDGDVLTVPQFSNTVKISGDVMYPSSVNYKEGETLSYYIDRAGGYGEKPARVHKGEYAACGPRGWLFYPQLPAYAQR
jgi:protein involved in polysaccharide export with SLBB domain